MRRTGLGLLSVVLLSVLLCAQRPTVPPERPAKGVISGHVVGKPQRSVWSLAVSLAFLSQSVPDGRPASLRAGAGTPLPQSAALGGRVLGEHDRPLPGVSVQAVTRSGLPGRLVARGVRAKTDEDGRFRLDGLRPDAYYLLALGSTPGALVAEPTATGEIYVSTYYPDATDALDATPLTVSAGEDRSSIAIRMAHARAYHIDGQVLDPDGKPAAGAFVTLGYKTQASTSSSGRQAGPDGVFRFAPLLPGEYKLSARPRATTWDRAEEGVVGVSVTVAAGDVEGVKLAMRRGVTIRGQVVTARGGPPQVAPPSIRLILENPDDLEGRLTAGAGLDRDWRFTFGHVFAPAVVRVETVRGTTWRMWIQAVRYRGRDVTDVPTLFEPAPSEYDIQVVVTDRPARLSGAVHDAAGQPASQAVVTLFPADPGQWTAWWKGYTLRTRRMIAGQTGGYVLADLAPGEYLVVATSATTSWLDPPPLSALAPQATRVTLAEGERRTLDLTVAEIRE